MIFAMEKAQFSNRGTSLKKIDDFKKNEELSVLFLIAFKIPSKLQIKTDRRLSTLGWICIAFPR